MTSKPNGGMHAANLEPKCWMIFLERKIPNAYQVFKNLFSLWGEGGDVTSKYLQLPTHLQHKPMDVYLDMGPSVFSRVHTKVILYIIPD